MPFNYDRKFATASELLRKTAAREVLKALPTNTQDEIVQRISSTKKHLCRMYVCFLLKELRRFGLVGSSKKYKYVRLSETGVYEHKQAYRVAGGRLVFPSMLLEPKVYRLISQALDPKLHPELYGWVGTDQSTGRTVAQPLAGFRLDDETARIVLRLLDDMEWNDILLKKYGSIDLAATLETEVVPANKELRNQILRRLWRVWLPLLLVAGLPENPVDGSYTNRITLSIELNFSLKSAQDIYFLQTITKGVMSDLDDSDVLIEDGFDKDQFYEEVKTQFDAEIDKTGNKISDRLNDARTLSEVYSSANWIGLKPKVRKRGPQPPPDISL